MKMFFADIIPKIKSYSKKLDDLTILTNHHWVALDDIKENKFVYIFEDNGDLDIYANGVEIDSGTWKLTNNNSLKIKLNSGKGYLLRHDFVDENIMALKVDTSTQYALFVNESKYGGELNSIQQITQFLEKKYLKQKVTINPAGAYISTGNSTKIPSAAFPYEILSQEEKRENLFSKFIVYNVKYKNGGSAKVYRSLPSGEFFYIDEQYGKVYFDSLEKVIHGYYLYLSKK
jgi:hypothetical protein